MCNAKKECDLLKWWCSGWVDEDEGEGAQPPHVPSTRWASVSAFHAARVPAFASRAPPPAADQSRRPPTAGAASSPPPPWWVPRRLLDPGHDAVRARPGFAEGSRFGRGGSGARTKRYSMSKSRLKVAERERERERKKKKKKTARRREQNQVHSSRLHLRLLALTFQNLCFPP